ncbi:hypothetical protein M446_1164 [Methylobacterium sp. 4-46]|uniref:hypothetical protein n=1 Tax=unclassified Methylobacterium TaxID=2615210 RepID=UPI000152DA5C|nr:MULTISPECIES: hypothetical protein [Methylobacterium]ACA15690.1 hypothetical protein M446_1164 [Methylobacterium sp. 4-46]WFT81401.1 hypothetical protein QA634_05785 [Methylobacterium nodulans]
MDAFDLAPRASRCFDALVSVTRALLVLELRMRIAHDQDAPIENSLRPWCETRGPSFDDIADDPVRATFRLGLAAVGDELHRIGGTIAMAEALRRVCQRYPEFGAYLVDVIDDAWTFVGGGDDPWRNSRALDAALAARRPTAPARSTPI